VLQGIKPRPEKMIREVLQWLKENLLWQTDDAWEYSPRKWVFQSEFIILFIVRYLVQLHSAETFSRI
jgi:hypothetical protein